MRPEERVRSFKMAGLVVFNALVFQEMLANGPLLPATKHKVLTLNQVLGKKGTEPLQRALLDAWHDILQSDYRPVFEVAERLLQALPARPQTESVLETLIRRALHITSSGVLLRHDLMGRIYHRLLLEDIAKTYATYYTSVPAAWLLARLALDTPNLSWKIDWENPESVAGFRVGDLACGSGTLLSAAYNAILDKHNIQAANRGVDPQPAELHKVLLEDVIWGFDVLEYAAHLSATTLALHNPSARIDGSNIYSLPLTGIAPVRLGSLDYMTQESVEVGYGAGPVAQKQSVSGAEKASVSMPRFDLIIMNPPFTRSMGTNLLFGSFLKSQRSRMQARLKQILQKAGFSGIGQAGLAAAFVVLGDEYLKPGGRLALVLPRAVLSGVAWKKVRELLADKYEVEYILASHQAPNGWNWSENTSLSEALLVARKLEEAQEPGKALLVNYWSKPDNEPTSLMAAAQVITHRATSRAGAAYDLFENANAAAASLHRAGAKIGESYAASWDAFTDCMEAWSCLEPFAQGELARSTFLFISTGALHIPGVGSSHFIPLGRLEGLAEHIGTDRPHRQKEFRKVTHPTNYPALWGHDAISMKNIAMPPNAWMEVRPGKTQRAATLWARRGTLVAIERLRLNTMRLVAAQLSAEVLACEWWPVRLKTSTTPDGQQVTTQDHETIQALWLNTTLGLLSWLALRQDTEGPWVAMKSETLRLLPLLDVSKLTGEQVQALLNLFKQFAQQELPPFPEQYAQASRGEGVKYEMDRAVLKAILGQEVDLKPLYQLLAREPILTLKPLA